MKTGLLVLRNRKQMDSRELLSDNTKGIRITHVTNCRPSYTIRCVRWTRVFFYIKNSNRKKRVFPDKLTDFTITAELQPPTADCSFGALSNKADLFSIVDICNISHPSIMFSPGHHIALKRFRFYCQRNQNIRRSCVHVNVCPPCFTSHESQFEPPFADLRFLKWSC